MKQKKSKKFVMQVPKCGVEPAGWEVTFYNGGSGNQEGGNEGDSSSKLDYTFDFTKLGSYDSDKKVTYEEDTYFDEAVFLYRKKEGLRIRASTNYINYNGTNANWTTITEGSILDTPDRYCGFDASKVSANAEITVTFGYDVKSSSNASGDTGALAIVDGTGKVLASKSGLKLKSGNDSGEISAKIAKDGKAILYFSRGNAGGGGLDVTSSTAKTAE